VPDPVGAAKAPAPKPKAPAAPKAEGNGEATETAAPAKPKKPKKEKEENGKKASKGKNRVAVLEALAEAGKSGFTRNELSETTGIKKGWAKLLGAPSKGNPGGLEGEGLVQSEKDESRRGLVYIITPEGRAWLKENK
jgi:hypothetical protein